ncbi:hypothetical protein ACHAWU_008985 [Discostella pseudostelligera]|uniref:Alpha/beta hydrolase fold-3 domain-containing protein n=1 Tax=Discostella pseudostelligera TaxID=259834 RepID=A0ABD3MM60_9STRA
MTAAANATDAAAIPDDGVKLSSLSSRDEKSIIEGRSNSAAPTSSTASSTDMSGSGSSCMDDDEANDVDADAADNYDFNEGDGDNTSQYHYHDNTLRQYFTESHTRQMDKLAQDENKKLNLNLGLPIDLTVYTRRESGDTSEVAAASPTTNTSIGVTTRVLRPPIQFIINLLDRILSYIESPLFQLWDNCIPLYIRQKLTFIAWGIYLPLHKLFIGRRSGLHRDVSLEYHALTSVLWWGRLFPVTIKRMRFSLSQLHVWHPPDRYPQWTMAEKYRNGNVAVKKSTNGKRFGIRGHLHEIFHLMKMKRTPTGIRRDAVQEASSEEMTVTGLFIQHSPQPSKKVIFWIYGGAFLAGDSRGNLGIAEKMGMLCATNGGNDEGDSGMRDVFIPDYRLVPEHHLDDAMHDVTLAYEYLIYERNIQPEDITLVGVSSGGGLVVLLLQALAKARQQADETKKTSTGDDNSMRCVPMPAGGVMIGPFVDYSEPKGTMKEFIKHDLIVNQSVYDEGIPFLEKVLGSHENRVKASPVYGSFDGLPPLCICVSKHEVVYDQAMLLAKRAEEQGVDVTVGIWKYM